MAIKKYENTARLNAYLDQSVKDKLEEYANSHFISISSAVNLILQQFFDGQEAMKSMGNLTELMNVLAKQTGIDLTAGQVSFPEHG